MGRCSEFLQSQAGFRKRTGSGGVDILTEDGKGLPQGKGLESKYNLYIGFRRNIRDESEVTAKFLFLYNLNRCSHQSFLSGIVKLKVEPCPSTDST